MLEEDGQIQFTAESIPSGIRARLVLQQNVLKALGSMGMMFGGAGQAIGGPGALQGRAPEGEPEPF